MPGSFFDSNVVLYLVSGDPGKADQAETVLRAGGTISAQVLNEVAHVARRKFHLSWLEARLLLDSVLGFVGVVRPVTLAIHQSGLALAERHLLSVYDGMIVASALDAGCDTLLSEDMHAGLLIEGRLRIVNPFVA